MPNLNFLLTQLSLTHYGINFLDIIILIVVEFYAREGYSLGFTLAALDLLSFFSSFVIALKFYGIIGDGLTFFFGLPLGIANAAGFFLTAFISEVILSIFFRKLLNVIPRFNTRNAFFRFFQKIDHWLGLLP